MKAFVFILDDDEMRIKPLKAYARDFVKSKADQVEFVVAHTVVEAKQKLKLRNHWDLAMLDHDLGGQVYVPSEEPETGFQLAKHIVEQGITFDYCIVHSMNAAGAKNMINLLETQGGVAHVPFMLMI